MKLTLNYHLVSYSQVGQEVTNYFAYVNPNGNVVEHRPVLCRDFLLDTLAHKVVKFKPKQEIYGYSYWKEVDPSWGLAIFEGVKKAFYEHQMDLLNEIEVRHGFSPTKFYPVEEVDNQCTHKVTLIPKCVAFGDKKWYSNTVFFSMWTFLLRYILGTKDATYKQLHSDSNTVLSGISQKLPRAMQIIEILNPGDNLLSVKSNEKNTIHSCSGFAFLIRNPKGTIFKEYADEIQKIW